MNPAPHNAQQTWNEYCQSELAALTPLLNAHGFSLEREQPHIKGERFLQQAVTTTSGKKLILYGRDSSDDKVVIKATRDRAGARELTHERTCRQLLQKINFAGDVFHTPEEVAWITEQGFVISIQEFIEQEKTFLEHTLEEQFALALASFKAQESAHATTYKHRRLIRGVYELRDSAAYLRNFADFFTHSQTLLPDDGDSHALLERAAVELKEHQERIEQYCGFLTHTDFVPHNLRIKDGTIYLLDHSSLTFGNKYEGWARFLNFMTLYHPALQQALEKYVKDNRSPEESEALNLMRIYRLGEIIFYYAKTLTQSSGNLATLNRARVTFWSTVLQHVLNHEPVPEKVITTYQTTRDSLRSDEERERQQGLH